MFLTIYWTEIHQRLTNITGSQIINIRRHRHE